MQSQGLYYKQKKNVEQNSKKNIYRMIDLSTQYGLANSSENITSNMWCAGTE